MAWEIGFGVEVDDTQDTHGFTQDGQCIGYVRFFGFLIIIYIIP